MMMHMMTMTMVMMMIRRGKAEVHQPGRSDRGKNSEVHRTTLAAQPLPPPCHLKLKFTVQTHVQLYIYIGTINDLGLLFHLHF